MRISPNYTVIMPSQGTAFKIKKQRKKTTAEGPVVEHGIDSHQEATFLYQWCKKKSTKRTKSIRQRGTDGPVPSDK